MTYEPLQDHLRKIYGGTPKDTQLEMSSPEAQVESSELTMLIRQIFAEIRAVISEEKRQLEDDLLEDFSLADTTRDPSENEVYSEALTHFSKQGYRVAGIVGRGKLLQNEEGEKIGLSISTGPNYITGKVQRVNI